MTNPTVVLSRFARSRGTNHHHVAVTAPLESDNGLSIADYMVDAIQHIRQCADVATYWSFADYETKEHKAESIRCNTAVVLEYPHSSRYDLETALDDLGYAHWLVGTEQTNTSHIAVIFPLYPTDRQSAQSGQARQWSLQPRSRHVAR